MSEKFNPREMQARIDRLRAEGKMPSLRQLLSALNEAKATATHADKQLPPIPDGYVRIVADDGGVWDVPSWHLDQSLRIGVGMSIVDRRVVPMDSDEICDAPSAGMGDEPSYTTPAGYPVCSKCGRSTRNFDQLVCAPCRKGNRLPLTPADRKFLRSVGIAR